MLPRKLKPQSRRNGTDARAAEHWPEADAQSDEEGRCVMMRMRLFVWLALLLGPRYCPHFSDHFCKCVECFRNKLREALEYAEKNPHGYQLPPMQQL